MKARLMLTLSLVLLLVGCSLPYYDPWIRTEVSPETVGAGERVRITLVVENMAIRAEENLFWELGQVGGEPSVEKGSLLEEYSNEDVVAVSPCIEVSDNITVIEYTNNRTESHKISYRFYKASYPLS